MGVIELEGARNVRDVGGIPVAEGRQVVPGRFIRGGALHAITPADAELLRDRIGVACVVDVRCGWEREAKPDVQIPGVRNEHIPFFDKQKAGVDYCTPAPRTRMDGHDLICDPDHFYRSMANPRTVAMMRRALDTIFEVAETGHACYFHCSGGKDRAAILAFLVLAILGAPREQIIDDYLLTNVDRARGYEQTLARFLRLCETEEYGRQMAYEHRARPQNLGIFCDAVQQEYGSLEAFFAEQLGIGEGRRRALQERFTRAAEAPCG